MSAIRGTTSGTFNFRPDFADWVVECFERIGVGPTALDDPRYIISARRSANILATDLAANRGVNLWLVGDETLNVPLIPGEASYLLPDNVITLLDCYRRQYTPDEDYQTLGFAPQVMTNADGEPILSALGEPMLIGPGSGVFSTTAGDQFVTMNWPAHGRAPGDPIFFFMPVTAGAMSLTNFAIVADVLDSDTLRFLAPSPAVVSHNGTGGTALFVSHAGLDFITVIMPFHGYVVGDMFPITVPAVVGGITLTGIYTVNEVLTPYSFNIATIPQAPLTPGLWLLGVPTSGLGGGQVLAEGAGPNPVATSTQTVFENGGQLLVTSQAPGVLMNDIIMWPVSRNDYAAFPNKNVEGTPSVFWFDRSGKRRIFLWSTPQDGSLWGFIAYRMRYMEDIEPDALIDMPRRFFGAWNAMLTAALAEKFRPELFQEKTQLAEIAWERAANADREMVSSYIVPQLQSYYR